MISSRMANATDPRLIKTRGACTFPRKPLGCLTPGHPVLESLSHFLLHLVILLLLVGGQHGLDVHPQLFHGLPELLPGRSLLVELRVDVAYLRLLLIRQRQFLVQSLDVPLRALFRSHTLPSGALCRHGLYGESGYQHSHDQLFHVIRF